jgi:hypothetical protein
LWGKSLIHNILGCIFCITAATGRAHAWGVEKLAVNVFVINPFLGKIYWFNDFKLRYYGKNRVICREWFIIIVVKLMIMMAQFAQRVNQRITCPLLVRRGMLSLLRQSPIELPTPARLRPGLPGASRSGNPAERFCFGPDSRLLC